MLSLNGNGDLPIGTFGAIPPGAAKSNWGADWKAASLQWHDRVAQLNMYGEHMSYRQNYMDLDPTYTDKFGDPLLRFTLDWTDHEHKQRTSPTISRPRSRRPWERRSIPRARRAPDTT